MQKNVIYQEKEHFQARTFTRDRFTWLSYILLGYGTYLQSTLGSLASVFQAHFHLNYSNAGIPTTAFAIGTIIIGLYGEQIIRPWVTQRKLWIWIGGAGQALGAVLMMISQNIWMVAMSTFTMGVFGTLMQFILQATLSDHHQDHRDVAISEANVMTSGCAVLAPLTVGGLQAQGLGWQTALLLAIGILLAIAFLFRHTTITNASRLQNTPSRQQVNIPHFSQSFWLYWLLLLCIVAMEWSIMVWSVTLLQNTGLPDEIATTIMSVFFIAEVGGRFLGSRLIRRFKSSTLLAISLGIVAVSFPIFWMAILPALKIAGLLLTGLGIANLFPLTSAKALGTTPHQTNAASARLSLSAGIAILAAPIVLGKVADGIGIHQAYGTVIGILILAGTTFLFLNYKLQKRRSTRAPAS